MSKGYYSRTPLTVSSLFMCLKFIIVDSCVISTKQLVNAAKKALKKDCNPVAQVTYIGCLRHVLLIFEICWCISLFKPFTSIVFSPSATCSLTTLVNGLESVTNFRALTQTAEVILKYTEINHLSLWDMKLTITSGSSNLNRCGWLIVEEEGRSIWLVDPMCPNESYAFLPM